MNRQVNSILSAGWQHSSECLSEWLRLLEGPADPPFGDGIDFRKEWARLTRLTLIVLVLLGAVFGVEYGLTNVKPNSPEILQMLIGGAIAAILYRGLLAPIFRVRISLYDAFFVLLLLGLPWLPVFAAVRAFAKHYSDNGVVGPLVVLTLFVICFYFIFNVSRGLARVSHCPLWRVVPSLLLPLGLVIYLIVHQHMKPTPMP